MSSCVMSPGLTSCGVTVSVHPLSVRHPVSVGLLTSCGVTVSVPPLYVRHPVSVGLLTSCEVTVSVHPLSVILCQLVSSLPMGSPYPSTRCLSSCVSWSPHFLWGHRIRPPAVCRPVSVGLLTSYGVTVSVHPLSVVLCQLVSSLPMGSPYAHSQRRQIKPVLKVPRGGVLG